MTDASASGRSGLLQIHLLLILIHVCISSLVKGFQRVVPLHQEEDTGNTWYYCLLRIGNSGLEPWMVKWLHAPLHGLRQSHRRIGWAKTSRAIQRLPADTSSAGGRGGSAAAHTPFPSQEKQPEVLQQRGSWSRDVHGFNGYRSLGVWWCLNMFGHQMTAGLRWKLPNDFAGGSFWLCSVCCNSLSDHCSIVWIGMSRREKGWTRDS